MRVGEEEVGVELVHSQDKCLLQTICSKGAIFEGGTY